MSENSRCYLFSEESGEYLGFEILQPDQMRPGEFLVPPNATLKAPLAAGPNERNVFVDGNWALISDYRGMVFYRKSDASRVSYDLGQEPDSSVVSIPPGLLEKPPWDDNTGKWCQDTTAIQAEKFKLLAEIEIVRESKESAYRSTVEVHGFDWDSGLKYLRNLERAIRVYAISPVPMWVDSLNQARSVQSVAFLEAIRDAIDADTFAAGTSLYQAKWQKKAEIEALTSVDILGYDVHSGWPW